MIKKLLKDFHDLSIRYKLLFSYLLLIAVPLCLFLLINTSVTSRETERQALYSARQVLGQTKSYLDFKAQSVRNSLNFIAINDTVQEIMERKPEYYSQNIGLWQVDTSKLTRLQYAAQNNPDISSFHFYMKQGPAAIFQNEDFIGLGEVAQAGWYRKLVSGKDVVLWFPSRYFNPSQPGDYIYVTRNITSGQNIQESIGIVRANIRMKVFRTILDQAVFTKATSAVLINSNRELICYSSTAQYRNPKTMAQILTQFKSGNFEDGQWQTLKHRRQKILVGVQNINKTDWKLILIIPYKDILGLSFKSRREMVIIFLLIAVLTFPLAFVVAASATNRFKKLVFQMRRVETGDFEGEIPPENNDEIGKLTKNFNYMLTRISTLMNEKYILGREIKNLELKALQAQINPHFLYNTLDLINWMSVRAKAPEIRRVVDALSKFYRLSLSKGEDVVTIKNEIEHVKAYVEIQNMRFQNGIQLEIEIPDHLYDYSILKLILQPIVENSIIHGILEKEEERGIIKISGDLEEDVVELYIEDDGVGIPEEKLATILTNMPSNEPHGYGITNINERIKLNYGPEFGLSYQSELGKGTILTIKIPAFKI